ncbi:MAG: hypothetical protein AAFY20_13250 [Cyanobacteria bacterium J06639_14]
MNDLGELIQQQASYADLVAWMQKRESCSYLQACLKINEALQRYRLRHSL